jgi:hypothetical protein
MNGRVDGGFKSKFNPRPTFSGGQSKGSKLGFIRKGFGFSNSDDSSFSFAFASNMTLAAVGQFCASSIIETNTIRCCDLIKKAAQQGAKVMSMNHLPKFITQLSLSTDAFLTRSS